MTTCKFEGCDRRVRAVGLCVSHYRMHLAGEELRPVKTYKRYPAPAPGKKICTLCERVKDVEEDFYIRADGVSPLSRCKDCMIATSRAATLRRREAKSDG